VALPVLARLAHKDIKPAPASRLVLARQMTAALAAALPGRDIHVVADAAYAGKELRRLPGSVTWTTCGVPELGHRYWPGLLGGPLLLVEEATEDGSTLDPLLGEVGGRVVG
jgi:hypothetical protein